MNLFLLLLSSLLFGLVCYFSFIRMNADLKKTFVLLTAYRLLFFIIQSLLFYAIYNNKLDTFFYHEALIELVAAFKQYPSDMILFFLGKYEQLHITEELQTYLYTEIRVAFFFKTLLPIFLISAGNYYLMGAWLTLLGSLCFIAFLSMYKKTDTFYLWFIVLLIPSFSIWTVGILKEAFVIPMLFLMFYFLNTIIIEKGKNIFSILFFLLVCWLAWNVKYYLVAVFFLGGIVYMLTDKISYSFNTVLFTLLVVAFCIIGLGYMHPALQWNALPEVIYISYNLTCSKFVDAYPCIPFDIDMTWTSIITNYPKAMLYAFCSPFPWQIHNFTSMLAAIESYVFLVLLIMLLYRWVIKKIYISNIELSGLFIILLLGSLLILASPNIGSFSRYRIFYLPIYAYILLRHSGPVYSTVLALLKKYLD